ncbi:ribosome biogenesis GTP-binding protein YihA/YsxC [Spiroplasma endosymbiont of Polydrusus formosus]|uniref:ribosome biogenesis GTP-binding protein YihA/YsxC n=1 Tax=Spiroplasma endosymbiont of Polydrusus formosus TaxID=3139326 RepID=UPI0035B4FEAF
MFKFKNANYITSAVNKAGWVNGDLLEIAFLGKSNVGKSSFLNMLTNHHQLAKVSQTPGKTRMLNFFAINNNQFYIVDAPGYGFSRLNDQHNAGFAKMMEEYLTQRNNLKFVCLLVDLRHPPTQDDYEMYQYLKHFNTLIVLIGTKLDKVKKNDIQKQEKIIKAKFNFADGDYFIKTSSRNKIARDECWTLFAKLLNFNE